MKYVIVMIILVISITGMILLFRSSHRPRIINVRDQVAHLSIDQVDDFQVDGKSLPKNGQLTQVIKELNHLEDFSPDHGGWAQQVVCVITTRSGQEYRFRVGYYLRQEGAVIEFFQGDGDSAYETKGHISYQIEGYAFSKNPPKVFADAGIVLPR
jgi:hypothetical protein